MNPRRKRLVALARGHPVIRYAGHAAEAVVFGTTVRARLAQFVLRHYFRSVHRRWWGWQATGEPHFSLHAGLLFNLFEGTAGDGVYALGRAFYTAEVIRERDTVLDIGCGDGSLTKRFYAPRAAWVDAIDIETRAIDYARRHNPARNVGYHLLDATKQTFPRKSYDVIVFDGALGHFSRSDSEGLLHRIAGALAPSGIFCGSESLGHEGLDHLQYFDTVEALRAMLSTAFPHVLIKTSHYGAAGVPGGRQEAYWRCGAEARLRSLQWA